uniref:Uncharacterized protein n=1 Tax=viral metagenome TaxID=1070528 RepID=A0A6C0J1D1_9ZZZZ|tara:strand:- start:201 stop:404 length:204 start_codon:yes stop_codon:yes gene_type:complete
MPIIDVEENIKTMRNRLMSMQSELFKLEGGLKVFEGFKDAGLTKINLPKTPNQPPIEELESIQEKPE